MNYWELEIVRAMETYGGQFIRQLAATYSAADIENRKKIRETWPDEWEKYRVMASNFPQPMEEVE